MQENYLNKAIQRRCHKKDNCFPRGSEHDCIKCHADQEADKSESDFLDMMARNERSAMTEW